MLVNLTYFNSECFKVYFSAKSWFFKATNMNKHYNVINRLTPKDPYRDRTAPLTSKHLILYIYSTNIGTEYFEHCINSPSFSTSKCSLFHNSNVFGSCIIQILYTECAKIKKKIIPAPKGYIVVEIHYKNCGFPYL